MKTIDELHVEASQEVDAAELACKTAGYTAESCGDLWKVFDRWLKHPGFLSETTILRAYLLGELTTLLGEEVLRECAWDRLTSLAKQYSVNDPPGMKCSLRIMAFEIFAEPPEVPFNLKLLFSLAHDPFTRWAVFDSYQNYPWRLRPHAHKYSNGSVTDQDCDQWLRGQGLGEDEFLIHTTEQNSGGNSATIPEATHLVNAAERFCAWAEGEHHLLSEARQHLLALMASIAPLQHLRYDGRSESDFPRRGHEGWTHDIRRFSDLPFQFYRFVFDPHELDAIEEPVMGDLHDDLADIYGDLWHGLQANRGGDSDEAVSLWVDSYFFHWGRHASSALAAIDTYYCGDPTNANKSREATGDNASS